MRGWNGMATVAWLFLATGALAGEPQLGKYLCITDYAAGIFFRPDGTLYAGQITVAPEKQKFFVTIRAQPGGEDRQDCFTKQQGEALKYEPLPPSDDKHPFPGADRALRRFFVPGGAGYDADTPEQFITSCLSNFTADVPDHRVLHSFDGRAFSDYTGLPMVFELFGPNDLTFRLYERSFSNVVQDSDEVVSRGRCEFIQANQ